MPSGADVTTLFMGEPERVIAMHQALLHIEVCVCSSLPLSLTCSYPMSSHGLPSHLTLPLQEVQWLMDMASYDIDSAELTSEYHGSRALFRLPVPGLAEKRPSLMRGDAVMLKAQHGDGRAKGFVWFANLDHVLISLPDAWSRHRHLVADVHFTFNRVPLRSMHRALEAHSPVATTTPSMSCNLFSQEASPSTSLSRAILLGGVRPELEASGEIILLDAFTDVSAMARVQKTLLQCAYVGVDCECMGSSGCSVPRAGP